MFGFSRGAFTVRRLGGLLGKCGILQKKHVDKVKNAYEIYKKEKDQNRIDAFVERYSRPCGEIKFIGVWDTVGAVGAPDYITKTIQSTAFWMEKFHDRDLGRNVTFACQALAIDDERKAFHPILWSEPPIHPYQTVEQVWFPGVHSNVGGGYAMKGLSDIPLRWMIQKVRDRGLIFKKEFEAHLYLDPNDKTYDSRSGFLKKGLYRRKIRTIAVGAKIHQSAVDRRNEASNNYNPKIFPEDFEGVF